MKYTIKVWFKPDFDFFFMKRKYFYVYQVENVQTGKLYLALTRAGSGYTRSRYFTTNKALYDDLLKYGSNQFRKQILLKTVDGDLARKFFREKIVALRNDYRVLYNDLCSYGYVYIVTDKSNGKRYIGQHRISGDPEKDDRYYGSGIIIGKLVRKHGIQNFEKEILEECMSEDELNERERFWIGKYNAVESPDFYNIAEGGDFGDTWTARSDYGKRKFRKRIAESNRTRKRDGSKISGKLNPAFGRHWYKNVETKQVYFLKPNDPMIVNQGLVPGTFRTKAHNLKIGNAHRGKKKTYIVYLKGKKCVNDGRTNKYVLPEEVEKYLSMGFKPGNVRKGCGQTR